MQGPSAPSPIQAPTAGAPRATTPLLRLTSHSHGSHRRRPAAAGPRGGAIQSSSVRAVWPRRATAGQLQRRTRQGTSGKSLFSALLDPHSSEKREVLPVASPTVKLFPTFHSCRLVWLGHEPEPKAYKGRPRIKLKRDILGHIAFRDNKKNPEYKYFSTVYGRSSQHKRRRPEEAIESRRGDSRGRRGEDGLREADPESRHRPQADKGPEGHRPLHRLRFAPSLLPHNFCFTTLFLDPHLFRG